MPKVDEAAIGAAGVMGGGALVVSVLGAEAPSTGLPQGAFFNRMPRFVSVTPEAIRELGLGSMPSLAQDGAALQVVLSWFHIGWPLSGKDARNMLVTGREEGGCRRRWGAGDKEVLLETSADSARHKAALHCK